MDASIRRILKSKPLDSTSHCFSFFLLVSRSDAQVAIYIRVHCPVANHVGLNVPCICATDICATQRDAAHQHCDFLFTSRSTRTVSGECNLSNFIHATFEILGKELQVRLETVSWILLFANCATPYISEAYLTTLDRFLGETSSSQAGSREIREIQNEPVTAVSQSHPGKIHLDFRPPENMLTATLQTLVGRPLLHIISPCKHPCLCIPTSHLM